MIATVMHQKVNAWIGKNVLCLSPSSTWVGDLSGLVFHMFQTREYLPQTSSKEEDDEALTKKLSDQS